MVILYNVKPNVTLKQHQRHVGSLVD